MSAVVAVVVVSADILEEIAELLGPAGFVVPAVASFLFDRNVGVELI